MKNIDIEQARKLITECWYTGVEAVKGEKATSRALQSSGITRIDNLLAVGKAASSMSLGALPMLAASGRALVITKFDHIDSPLENSPQVEILESAHPVPDENSLAAGIRALEFVQSIPREQNLVLLVSGGASALVECLPESVTLSQLSAMTRKLLAHGFNITQINAVRTRLSRIKGGKLLQHFTGAQAFAFAISDVPNDDISVIGSGIGSLQPADRIDFDLPGDIMELLDRYRDNPVDDYKETSVIYEAHIIASNRIARDAAADLATGSGYPVRLNEESLHQDVDLAADMIAGQLLGGETGVYIWGGEPTVVLPDNPGRGGRNQHLALSVARRIQSYDNLALIAAGTDGTDGPTDAAGGIIDGTTWNRLPGAAQALTCADAGTFLEQAGALLKSGPTGTNVMDLVIGVKW